MLRDSELGSQINTMELGKVQPMTVTVRLFAMLRERAGVASLELDLRDAPTAAAAMEHAAHLAGLGAMLTEMNVAVAVNREYADAQTVLHDGDEVALIPPVSGGASARIHVAVTETPLSLDDLVAFVRDPGAGAIVTFLGEPRDVDRLDYEAYVEMAEDRMRAVLADVSVEHALIAAAAGHRIGPVPQGEPCVVVAVSSAHRPQAFAAARDAMDRIKADVPIWKREVRGERADWVVPEQETERR